ncbi:MAG: tyrosine-type recombinase/integrase [Terriglobales bacterium]
MAAEPTVNLTKRVKTEAGLRYCPIVSSNNGRVKPDVVLVAGREERHPEGAYYLEWREDGKRRRLSVRNDAQDAAAQRLKKEADLNARSHGLAVSDPAQPNGRRSLAAAVSTYLSEIEITKKPKTFAAYSTALQYFQDSCAKQYLEDIERHDLLKFIGYLRDTKEQSPRSTYNKFANVLGFFKAQKVRGLVEKNDWPRFTEEEPDVYEQEELDTLFAACDGEERLWFEFFLCTGMREQEVMYCYWSDVNLKARTVRVTHKPDRGWTPKAYKEREIPIPNKLAAALQSHKPRTKDGKACPLLFATSGCNVKHNFLDCLKAVATRAKLDPENFWLHKFRATYATRSLWGGVDLRTVQARLGHKDMESTMRYLKPQRNNDSALAKLNEIFA